MGNFITALNTYFKEHTEIFNTINGGMISIVILLFVFSLIHSLRGNKHPFPIIMNICSILAPAFYLVHALNEDHFWIY